MSASIGLAITPSSKQRAVSSAIIVRKRFLISCTSGCPAFGGKASFSPGHSFFAPPCG